MAWRSGPHTPIHSLFEHRLTLPGVAGSLLPAVATLMGVPTAPAPPVRPCTGVPCIVATFALRNNSWLRQVPSVVHGHTGQASVTHSIDTRAG